MKQIILCKKVAYGSACTGYDYTLCPDGAIALIDLMTNKALSAAPTHNFSIVLGAPKGVKPFVISEVDFKSLQVVKSTYVAGTPYEGVITFPDTVVVDKDYTIVISKKGAVRNERFRWSYTTRARSTVTANVIDDLVKSINNTTASTGFSASKTGTKLTISAPVGAHIVVQGADDLIGATVAVTAKKEGNPAVLDKEYVKDLARQCAQNKGFNYTAPAAGNIYPDYPEAVDAEQYTMFTLRFAVPRTYCKTTDEVVYQVVHICLPVGAGAIGTLDTIFKTTAASSGSGSGQ